MLALQSAITVMAVAPVRLVINGGAVSIVQKNKIEQAVSQLLTEINHAQEANLPQLNFSQQTATTEAQLELNMLWRNEHFRCIDEEIVCPLLTTREGFQVRGIPLSVKANKGSDENTYQEAVINLDKAGIITSFYYTINAQLYSNLSWEQMKDRRREVTDIRDRMMILDYVEHFRTAYNQKDLKFLNQVFSFDALIITGRVIKVSKSELEPTGKRIIYRKQDKRQYLSNLKRAFDSNQYIKVTFDDVTIVEHPTIHNVYGVTVLQHWNSSRYSDEGYVFMVWDFRNPDEPQIHVRTWQPEYVDKAHGQRLAPNDVFTLSDFDL